MLSPKMQRPVRINETQLQMLAERARYDPTLAGPLYKRTADGTKWQLRWFTLYQNVLFYSESENWSRPTGIVFLEGSYCDRLIVTGNKKPAPDKQYCFAITYRREHQRAYELRAENESDCQTWIQAIRQASFNKLMLQKEELEQKHLHLLQIVESEKTAKWQYTQQCEELTTEIKKLRAELCMLKKEWRLTPSVVNQSGEGPSTDDVESEDLKKIRKVQSFFRGWLCRHRWKQIIEEYIRSPHAESMRKRNSLVFRMVETEEEYVAQLEILVACFLRPMKMLASSKKPPCSHDDLNSIFLNAETVFLFGEFFFVVDRPLTAEVGKSLKVGDLFDMLLPMLHIYQEYVRNHHFSLQVLTECKQNTSFAAMLNRLENKAPCQGRSLETFLTYPMHQIPRYIITLHELLAHTPHDHVERKSLENARDQLEDLSRQMHDEVSETENIRKNLAIERMIIEGCDILMDVNQVFVRQGSLLHVVPEKSRSQRGRLSVSNKSSEKEQVRQCFLFSSHLIIATRTQGGRLTLVPNVGKISLADVTLVEDPGEHNNSTNDDDGDSSVCSMSSQSSGISESSVSGSTSTRTDYHGLDFQLLVDSKKDCGGGSGSMVIHLVAPSVADKAAWISDLSQCIDNVHFNDFVHLAPDTSSVTHPQSIRNDPKLFTDDVDIRFSRTLNSCKVPQIRYATPSRLLDRLTDLRFLSIDFLNTFLLTYRVFTDSVTVLDALKKVFYAGETEAVTTPSARNSVVSIELCSSNRSECGTYLTASNLEAEPRDLRDRGRSLSPRRTSSGSTVSGYGSETHERERSHSREYSNPLGLAPTSRGQWWRRSRRKEEEERLDVSPARSLFVSFTPSSPSPSTSVGPNSPFTSPRGSAQWGASSGGLRPGDSLGALSRSRRNSRQNQVQSQSLSSTETAEAPEEAEEADAAAAAAAAVQAQDDGNHLTIPQSMGTSSSADTLTDAISVDSAHTNFSTSTNTLVAFNMDESANKESTPNLPENAVTSVQESSQEKTSDSDKDSSSNTGHDNDEKTEEEPAIPPPQQHALRRQSLITGQSDSVTSASDLDFDDGETSHSYSYSVRSSWASQGPSPLQSLYGARRFRRRDGDGPPPAPSTTSRHAPDSPQLPRSVGVVVTSNRQSQRRSSTSHAAAAFAVATAGSSNPRDHPIIQRLGSGKAKGSLTGSAGPSLSEHRGSFQNYRKESVMSTAATMRVLNVLRHWISKHQQDFDNDSRLKNLTVEFLEDVLSSPQLLPAEHKAASQLLRLLTREEPAHARIDLDVLLAPPMSPSKDGIETLSALEIAEQMTYLDHKIFVSIRSEELLNQAWMKPDKATRAPNVLLITKRFNEVSLLVSSEIMRRTNLTARIAVIDKWTAVADICRCLHNFNGVLQICSSLNSNAVFRLKKTWEKLSKTTRQTIEKLQNIVSSDGRFRNLRDALHRCDPPCIPYLGMYLTDLSFIEEGTPNFTDDGLLNFSKMRMIAHVIREIRHFQQMPYKIEHVPKVTNYLLDPSLLLSEDELYQLSLEMEPRQSRLGSISQQAPPPPTSLAT